MVILGCKVGAQSQLRRVEGSEAKLTHRFDASGRVPSANGLEKSLAEALLLLRRLLSIQAVKE